MIALLKKEFEMRPLPARAEVLEQAEKESILFLDADTITEDWILLSQAYQTLFGRVFLEKTGLDRLEQRVLAAGIHGAGPEQKGFYQKYDRLGLSCFYIRCFARPERLSEEEMAMLKIAVETENEGMLPDIMKMVDETFAAVMAVSPEYPDTVFEPKMTLHRDYIVKGEEIPLVFRTVADFTPEGSLVSEKMEEKRLRITASILRQLDDGLSADLGASVRTTAEVFDN